MRSLRHLALGMCKITDEGLAELKGLTDLESLVLTATPITDVGVEHLTELTNLRALYLGGTSVSDDGLAHLARMRELRRYRAKVETAIETGLEPVESKISENR